jgi:hypothetical protein
VVARIAARAALVRALHDAPADSLKAVGGDYMPRPNGQLPPVAHRSAVPRFQLGVRPHSDAVLLHDIGSHQAFVNVPIPMGPPTRVPPREPPPAQHLRDTHPLQSAVESAPSERNPAQPEDQDAVRPFELRRRVEPVGPTIEHSQERDAEIRAIYRNAGEGLFVGSGHRDEHDTFDDLEPVRGLELPDDELLAAERVRERRRLFIPLVAMTVLLTSGFIVYAVTRATDLDERFTSAVIEKWDSFTEPRARSGPSHPLGAALPATLPPTEQDRQRSDDNEASQPGPIVAPVTDASASPPPVARPRAAPQRAVSRASRAKPARTLSTTKFVRRESAMTEARERDTGWRPRSIDSVVTEARPTDAARLPAAERTPADGLDGVPGLVGAETSAEKARQIQDRWRKRIDIERENPY